MKSLSLFDAFISSSRFAKVNFVTAEATIIFLAVVYVSVLSQISIPLPFTPIPLTLQTFAVLSASFALGAKRSFISLCLYTAFGCLGMPIFAGGASGIGGASFGYVIGFIFASLVLGYLVNRGWDKRYSLSFAAMVVAHFVIYFFGIGYMMMALNITDIKVALVYGALPFLLTDLIKSLMAVGIFPSVWKVIDRIK